MQKVIKLWFVFALSTGVLASCSQDGREPSSAIDGGGETVTLSLSAEVSVDDPSLRAINYKLGKNSKDQLVPMPQFVDGQEVLVHTILKSSRSGSVAVAKTLKWKYDATKKKLVLGPTNKNITQDENNIVIPNFNTDGGTKLYISGLIGGTLSGTQVSFTGTRELKGVSGNEGDIVGSLNVPYAFPWTELDIDTSNRNNTKESNGSYKYAKLSEGSTDPKFFPQGALIAVKLGSKQRNGAYDFTVEGFSLKSNVWGDKGTFELNTALPTDIRQKVLPTWTETTGSGSLVYSFASEEDKPGTISDNQLASKTYYVWVMPHKTQPARSAVGVTMQGKSSDRRRSYYGSVRTWFTDYQPSLATQGKVTNGRIQLLTARATHTFALPIEYVTDYNLAGGDGLTYTTTNVSPQPAGVQGDLRFASSHSNDQSGYYNFYRVVGRQHPTYNPQSRNLQTEVDAKLGADTYFIPEQDHWWGVWPSRNSFVWPQSEALNRDEYFKVGYGDDSFRGAFRSDYSKGFSINNLTSDAIVYAIRFKGHPDSGASQSALSLSWDYDATTGRKKTYQYEYVGDDSWKCAYRFRRVGGVNAFTTTNANLTSRFVIDVVYLGEETVPTTLADISNSSWWDARQSLTMTKTFSISGYFENPGELEGRGYFARYWARNWDGLLDAWSVHVSGSNVVSRNVYPQSMGFPVRLFSRLL